MGVTGPAADRSDDPLSPTEDDMRKAIELGLADVEAGRTIEGHEALRRFRALGEQLRVEAAANGAAQRQG